MQKLIFIFLLSFLSFISFSFALECYRVTQNSADYVNLDQNLFLCPIASQQCFKFVCLAQTPLIAKGCMDLADPNTQQATLQAQCTGRQGTGRYYTCNNNRCNSASTYSLSIVGVLLSVTMIYKIFGQ